MRSVFITGAGSGLGREIALAFAAQGFRVAVTGIERIKETTEELRHRGGQAIDIQLDLTQPAQVEKGICQALEEFGHIDVLVNNAGIEGPTAPVPEVSLHDWERTLAVNLTGAFLCDRALAPQMIARRSGCIIHMASVAALQAYPLRAPYAASKWALLGLTETLAVELGPYNIRVNAVCPGPVSGNRMNRVMAQRAQAEGRDIKDIEEDYKRKSVLRRLVDPQDVVDAVLFLASDAARNITGQAIRVCGGYGL